jgi:outer membrane lipopolysaccharide assembly protein LptE/RlpB
VRGAAAAALLLAAAAAWLPGCGYTLKSAVPSYIKTLAIPVFQNNTVEYGLADEATQALVDGFLADRHLQIVSERDANAVLRGTIISYRNRVFGYTREERATEYEVLLVVQITFRDQVKKRDLWKEDALAVRTTYNVSPVGATGEARTEADARREVVQKLADQVVSRTVQGW